MFQDGLLEHCKLYMHENLKYVGHSQCFHIDAVMFVFVAHCRPDTVVGYVTASSMYGLGDIESE